MLVSFAKSTIIEVRPGMVVDHGDETLDWATPTLRTIDNCVVDTSSGSRDTTYRVEGIRTDLVVLAPFDSDILESSHIRVPGYDGDFTIIDGPRRQRSPTGALAHLQLALQKWEG